MQLSAAAALIAAAAAVTAACPRVTGNVGRRRARTKLRDQIVVLRGLRCRQLQILILGLEVGQFALRQEVEDGAAVLVVRVNNVARGVLYGVARVARLRRHVVAHLGDSCTVFAATLSGLHLHGSQLLHESRLLVTAGKLSLCKAVGHCHVGAVDKLRLLVKSVAKALIYTVDLTLDISKIRGQHIAIDHAAGIASVVAPAVAAPAKDGKNEEENNELCAVTAPAETAAVVGRRDRHGQHGSAAIGKRHSITPLKDFYSSNRGHDVDFAKS